MFKFNFLIVLFVLFNSTILSAQTRIKMTRDGNLYTIPCKVNGLPLKFIFDTGASDVSISLTEALFMLKNGYLSKHDIGESVYYGIANGNVAKGTKLNIKEIEFGGLKLYNVKASIIHESNAPLLLGQSAISKLGKILLDGDELTILSKNSGYKNHVRSRNTEKDFSISKYARVFTFSPITDLPRMGENEKRIGVAQNNEVVILEKYNDNFYKVKSGNITGYLWKGWIK